MAIYMTRTNSLILCALLGLAACDGSSNKDDTGVNNGCTLPLSGAGGDLTINLGEAATLDGSASEWCAETSDSLTFIWSFIQTPPDSVVDETSLSDNRTNTAITPVFTPDVKGDYVLSLQLTDDNGESNEDIVVVTVTAGDEPPIADCGGPYTGEVGSTVNIDGTAAYDPENAELDYYWSLNGPDCSGLTSTDLRNQNGDEPIFVPDCGGIFEVTMVVSDGGQYSDPDICIVEVESESGAPVADAGTGGELGACADNPLQLNGWASYDPDGDPLTYEWSIISVPSGSSSSNSSFSDINAPDPYFTWDVEGDYVIQLQVNDGEEWSSPDILTISIAGLDENKTPVSNAGADVTVEVLVTCSSSSYIWTCPDCPEEIVELDGSGSYDEDGDNLDYEWTEASGTLDITSPFNAITTAIIPPQAAEYGVKNAIQFEVDLSVEDCDESSTDQMIIYYSCEGEQ